MVAKAYEGFLDLLHDLHIASVYLGIIIQAFVSLFVCLFFVKASAVM